MLEEVDLNTRLLWFKSIGAIEVSNCHMDFYHDKKRIDSCEELKNSNLTRVRSIFHAFNGGFMLNNVDYKRKICPLMFSRTLIKQFSLVDLMDTFYKKNVISFTNDSSFSDLKAIILKLSIHRAHNINLDSSILPHSLFKNLSYIFITGSSLNSIEGEIFRNLNRFYTILISAVIFRKINPFGQRRQQVFRQ